jgi:hypothetical protein
VSHEVQHESYGIDLRDLVGTGDASDGFANLIWAGYGQQFLQTMGSVYMGYHPTGGVAEVIVGTLYGFIDGLIGGAVFAWLYNRFVRSTA